MISLLFNRQIFPIILNWRIFWILVVHISRSVVSRSVALVLVVQSLVVQSLVVQLLVVQSLVVQSFNVQSLSRKDNMSSFSLSLLSALCHANPPSLPLSNPAHEPIG